MQRFVACAHDDQKPVAHLVPQQEAHGWIAGAYRSPVEEL